MTTPVVVASTTLVDALPATNQKYVTLANVTGVSPGIGLFVGKEAMSVLTITGNLCRVTRGVDGTVAAVHAAGATVWIGPNRAVIGEGPFWFESPVAGAACSLLTEQYDQRIDVATGTRWKCAGSIWVAQ